MMVDPMSCACPQINAYDCIRTRYPRQYICDDVSGDIEQVEPCECACHDYWMAGDDDER